VAKSQRPGGPPNRTGDDQNESEQNEKVAPGGLQSVSIQLFLRKPAESVVVRRDAELGTAVKHCTSVHEKTNAPYEQNPLRHCYQSS
jgi:hypothetical protein